MATNGTADEVVANPTYMGDIRWFFTPQDVAHMGGNGVDLSGYDGVKKNALAIYMHTSPPHPTMPPDPAPKWSAARSETFLNWIRAKYPLGAAAVPAGAAVLAAAPTDRLRKNAATLSPPEIAKLQAAFAGLIARDPSDPQSYYAIAGIHGRPGLWCAHHEFRFNPWHRSYLKVFEDALRSVPDCADVTLPYWDIRTPLPEVLLAPPLLNYALQQDPGGGNFPLTTSRFPMSQITANLQQSSFFDQVDRSLKQSRWGDSDFDGYQLYSIQAHDNGHNSIGPTMQDQDIAAFDPVFWFYHCNLDRLWLSWQVTVGATTLDGFKTTIDATDLDKLVSPLNGLPPFTTTSDETIAFGVSYDKLELAGDQGVTLENHAGSLAAAKSFSIKSSTPVSVRVKGINRLSIPGSFTVNLLADGEPVASQFFFQPTAPQECDGCKKHPLININFAIDQDKLVDRKLSVTIDVRGHEEIGTFPLAQAGNPTINARLLLEDE